MKRYKYESTTYSALIANPSFSSFFNISNRGFDPNKTVNSSEATSLFSKFSNILSDFPEYNASSYLTYITNIGIIAFEKENLEENSNYVIVYDLLDKDNTELDSINPDNSILGEYTYINNPFNYRVINLQNGSFVPDREIISSESKYIRINADYIFIGDSAVHPSSETGWFSLPSDAVISKVCYYYKPAFRLSGNAISESSTITNYKNTDDFIISSSLDSGSFGWNCNNATGYLEVR